MTAWAWAGRRRVADALIAMADRLIGLALRVHPCRAPDLPPEMADRIAARIREEQAARSMADGSLGGQ